MLKEVVAVFPVSGSKKTWWLPNSARPSPDPAARRPRLLYTASAPPPPAAPAPAQAPLPSGTSRGGLREDTLPMAISATSSHMARNRCVGNRIVPGAKLSI